MIKEVLLIVGPVVTGFVTWFFARRKMAAEATGVELKN